MCAHFPSLHFCHFCYCPIAKANHMTKHSFKVWRNRRIILHTRRRKIIVLALKMWQICSYEVVYEFCYSGYISFDRGFPSGSVVKNPSAMQEMWVWSLGQKDPLEKEMASHSNIPAWKIPWTQEPDGLRSQRVGHGWTHMHASFAWSSPKERS